MAAGSSKEKPTNPPTGQPAGDQPGPLTGAAAPGNSIVMFKRPLKKATGAKDEALQTQIVNQVLNTLWLPPEVGRQDRFDRINAAIDLLEEIKPRGVVEGMLAAQMVATHSAAMECLRRAMIAEQGFDGRDANLRHAEKPLATYARQMEVTSIAAMDSNRPPSHINVEAGGQAVVGNVQDQSRVAKLRLGRSPLP